MNIIFIVADTLRKDALGCYGSQWVKTPSLDKLGEKSIVFEKAYVGSFPTMPMRADLLSGKYCFQSFGWAPLPEGTIALQSLLQESGYVTAMVTDHTQMLAPGYNYHQGFFGVEWIRGFMGDSWIGTTESRKVKLPCAPEKLRTSQDVNPENIVRYLKNISQWRDESEWFTPRVIQTAANWLEKNCTQKFFLYLDIFSTHEPWTPPKRYVEMYDPDYQGEAAIYPRYGHSDYLSKAELHHLRAIYAGTVTLMDRWLGKLFDKVSQLGIWDETLIIFISDHGFLLGEHNYVGKHAVLSKRGWPFYEEVSHIPFLMKLPGQKKGKHSTVLAQLVDIMPTILEFAKLKPPKKLHGFSLAPALQGKVASPRKIAVTSPLLRSNPEYRIYCTITDGEWTLIYGEENERPKLYHLPSDAKQLKNLYKKHSNIAKNLHKEYLGLLRKIGTEESRLKLRLKLPSGSTKG